MVALRCPTLRIGLAVALVAGLAGHAAAGFTVRWADREAEAVGPAGPAAGDPGWRAFAPGRPVDLPASARQALDPRLELVEAGRGAAVAWPLQAASLDEFIGATGAGSAPPVIRLVWGTASDQTGERPKIDTKVRTKQVVSFDHIDENALSLALPQSAGASGPRPIIEHERLSIPAGGKPAASHYHTTEDESGLNRLLWGGVAGLVILSFILADRR